jgi:hypothetical protein
MVTVDSAGIVISDVAAAGSVPLPRHTERIALLAGYGPLDGAAGWHAGTQLTQVGARTLIGPGCTLTSSAVLTRRAGGPVAVAQVIAADAVAGFGVVTTRLPSTVTAVAVVLETATADGADTLDLGLTGARRDGSPARLIVSGGRTIGVYGVLPDGKGAPVEVTVASGESLHLGGVLGAALGADALTESLRRHDVAGVVATGLTATTGSVQVRWLQTSKGDQVR